jgi:hypothetical protein
MSWKTTPNANVQKMGSTSDDMLSFNKYTIEINNAYRCDNL